MEPRTFYVDYARFSKIYYAYPFLFAGIAWGGLQVVEWLIVTALLTVIGVWMSKLLFRKIIYPRMALTVTDTGLETTTLTGKKQSIPFTELLGPFEEKLPILQRHKFMSSRDPKLVIIVTSLTEGFEELVILLKQKIHDAEKA